MLTYEFFCSNVPIDHYDHPVVYVITCCIYIAGLIQAGCFLPQGRAGYDLAISHVLSGVFLLIMLYCVCSLGG